MTFFGFPVGHPLAGQPMELPAFASDFLRAGWGAHESALCIARKNAKSAICAVLALGYLVGPLRQPGWRGAVASVSKEKAAELRGQIEAIAQASQSRRAGIRAEPLPRSSRVQHGESRSPIERPDGRPRGLIRYRLGRRNRIDAGAVPRIARGVAIVGVGERRAHYPYFGPGRQSALFSEILSNPAVVTRIYSAPDGCKLDDEDAWRAANPGLGTIKQLSYMRAEVQRIRGAPGDENSYRAFDLNQKLDPTREMILSPDDLRACFVDELPPREGPCFLGFDFGESVSASTCTAIFPQTGRSEFWMAFGSIPPITERAKRDSAPYVEMVNRGELRLYPGRTVKLDAFLADVQADLAGSKVKAAAADSYKDAEALDHLDRAAVRWPITFRRVGAGKSGGADVRAFQRLVLHRKLAMLPNLALVTAISKSTVRRDGNGNPAIDRATSRGRIDLLSSTVIACGLAEPAFDRKPRRRRFYMGSVG